MSELNLDKLRRLSKKCSQSMLKNKETSYKLCEGY